MYKVTVWVLIKILEYLKFIYIKTNFRRSNDETSFFHRKWVSTMENTVYKR